MIGSRGLSRNGLFLQFNTPNGEMPQNVMSQVTQSIIQCLAHLLLGYAEYYEFSQDFEKMPGILVIDVIEGDLQRFLATVA